MQLLTRFADKLQGNITFIGNTLSLSRRTNQRQPGRECVGGAFISLKPTRCNTFPAYTTCDYRLNGSQAILILPDNAEVVYAELIWSGTAKTGAGSAEHVINDSIQFTPPGMETLPLLPHTETHFMDQMVAGTNVFTYTRSANVTQWVSTAGAGIYAVGGVPALLDVNDSSSRQSGCAGWTLAVVYRDRQENTPLRSISLYVGSLTAMQNQRPAETTLTGFFVPQLPKTRARLLISAAEGDYSLRGDQLFFGSPGNAKINLPLSGPNNPERNFFASQINDDNGCLVTSGSFGTHNHYRLYSEGDMFAGVVAGRQGWDITNVDATGHLDAGQTSAVLKVSTILDSVLINAAAIAIDLEEPKAALRVTKTANQSSVLAGTKIQYKIKITNTGGVLLTDVLLKDLLPEGLVLIPESVKVDGWPPDGTLDRGIKIKKIEVGECSMINYEVNAVPLSNNGEHAPFINTAQVSAVYTVSGQQRQISGSDQATVDYIYAYLTKQSSVDSAQDGDMIEYLVTFENRSSLPLAAVKIIDTLPAELVLVEGSIEPAPQPGESLSTGISVGDVPVAGIATLKFKTMINAPTADTIVNTASSTFIFQGDNEDKKPGSHTGESNKASKSIDLIRPALDIVKSANRTFVTTSGDEVVYTLTVTNLGNVELTDITVTDPIPIGMSYKAVSTMKNGSAPTDENPANGIGISSLAPGESFVIVFTLIVA